MCSVTSYKLRKKDSLGGAQTAVRITRRDIDSTMSITPQENCWPQQLMPEDARPAQNENGIRGSGPGVELLRHDSINGVAPERWLESRERHPNVRVSKTYQQG